MKDKTGQYRFVLSGSCSGRITDGAVLLYPFKNLAAREFAYPFHGTSKVRDALKIHYRPLLGEGMQHVGFVPFFTRNEKKSSAGCLFMTNEAEASAAEQEALCLSDDCVVWPESLAFAGEVGPEGLIVWSRGDCVTSVWIKNWIPVMYRVSAPGTSAAAAAAAAAEYIEGSGGSAERVFMADFNGVSAGELQAYGSRTVKLCPAYAQLDLSARGANIQEMREKLIDSVSKTARFALASGLVCLIGAAGLYAVQSLATLSAGLAPLSVYETAFGESSAQPVVSSLGRLRAASDSASGESLSAMMEDLASVHGRIENSGDIVIETLRYGSDGADLLGTADGNEAIQSFRNMLEELGYGARIDNIQTIPGRSMRFNMNISRSGGKIGGRK